MAYEDATDTVSSPNYWRWLNNTTFALLLRPLLSQRLNLRQRLNLFHTLPPLYLLKTQHRYFNIRPIITIRLLAEL